MAASVASNVTLKIGEMSSVIDSYVGPVLKNNYFKGALFLFFGLYAGFLAPALPNSVLHFFDTVVGKLLFIFLIAFIATRQIDGSIGVALIVAVMFLLTLTVLNNVKMSESFRNLGMEHFELMNQMRDVVNEQFVDADTGSTSENPDKPTKLNSAQAETYSCLSKCVEDLSAADKKKIRLDFCSDSTTHPSKTRPNRPTHSTHTPPSMPTSQPTAAPPSPPSMPTSQPPSMSTSQPPATKPPATKAPEHFESQYASFDLY